MINGKYFGAIQETITEAYKTAMGRDKWKAKWREITCTITGEGTDIERRALDVNVNNANEISGGSSGSSGPYVPLAGEKDVEAANTPCIINYEHHCCKTKHQSKKRQYWLCCGWR
jgi:hypothetical protein